MTKAPSREMVVLDLDHQLGSKWFPLRRSLRAPPAWPTGCLTSEAWRLDKFFEFGSDGFAVFHLNARRESDMI